MTRKQLNLLLLLAQIELDKIIPRAGVIQTRESDKNFNDLRDAIQEVEMEK